MTDFIGPTLGRFDRWRDDQVRLTCQATLDTTFTTTKPVGCPAIRFDLVSTGKRKAKIVGVFAELQGHGFVEEFQAGFRSDFSPNKDSIITSMPEAITVTCPGLDKPDTAQGWVLEQDDLRRFIYPVGIPVTQKFATCLCDNLSIYAKASDGSHIEIVNGDMFQSLLRPAWDMCIEGQLKCQSEIEIHLNVLTTTPPRITPFGEFNAGSITMTGDDPSQEDFLRDS